MDALSVLENSYYVINRNFGFYKKKFGHTYYLNVKLFDISYIYSNSSIARSTA